MKNWFLKQKQKIGSGWNSLFVTAISSALIIIDFDAREKELKFIENVPLKHNYNNNIDLEIGLERERNI